MTKKLSPKLIRLGRKLTHWLSVIVIGAALGLSLQFVRAWTEPSAAPPGGNLGAPINTGANIQTKIGGLNISGKIKVGNDAQSQEAGQIRWTGTDFEGFDGTNWESFTAQGGGGGGLPTCSISGPHGEWAEGYLLDGTNQIFFQAGASAGTYVQSALIYVSGIHIYYAPGLWYGVESGSFQCLGGSWNGPN